MTAKGGAGWGGAGRGPRDSAKRKKDSWTWITVWWIAGGRRVESVRRLKSNGGKNTIQKTKKLQIN